MNDDIKKAIDDAEEVTAVAPSEKKDEDSAESRTQRERLREVGSAAALWTDGDTMYASVEVADHIEHFPIRSSQFRRWLTFRYFDKYGVVATRQQVEETLAFFRDVVWEQNSPRETIEASSPPIVSTLPCVSKPPRPGTCERSYRWRPCPADSRP